MDALVNWLSSNPVISIIVAIVVGILLVSIAVIYLVAFFQGREISFWPPKIGNREQEKSTSESTGKQFKKISEKKSDTPVHNETEGMHIGGNVNFRDGGDLVGRDKYGADGEEISKIIETLLKHIPRNNVSPEDLDNALRKIRVCSEQINEWKSVHDFLTDIFTATEAFLDLVKRSRDVQDIPTKELNSSWRVLRRKVELYRIFASNIKHIGRRYEKRSDDAIQGEPWAVQIIQKVEQIQIDLEKETIRVLSMANLLLELKDLTLDHLYMADKLLLEHASAMTVVSQNFFLEI